MAVKKTNKAGPSAVKPKTSKASAPAGGPAVVPPIDGSVHYSVERIDNGFLHRHSISDGKGNYTEKKVYSPKANAVVPPPKSSAPQRGTGTQRGDGDQRMNVKQKLNKPMPLSRASKKAGATDVPGRG